jgi:hypothetical protein
VLIQASDKMKKELLKENIEDLKKLETMDEVSNEYRLLKLKILSRRHRIHETYGAG